MASGRAGAIRGARMLVKRSISGDSCTKVCLFGRRGISRKEPNLSLGVFSLRRFGHLSYISIKIRRKNFHLVTFSDIMTELTQFFSVFKKIRSVMIEKWPKEKIWVKFTNGVEWSVRGYGVKLFGHVLGAFATRSWDVSGPYSAQNGPRPVKWMAHLGSGSFMKYAFQREQSKQPTCERLINLSGHNGECQYFPCSPQAASVFILLIHFGHFFAETFWSLKHFGHLSHSCIKTCHNSVF